MRNELKKTDAEKVRLREENAELALDNNFLRREIQNQPFLRQRLDAAIAERDAYKKRALIAESSVKKLQNNLKKLQKEVEAWSIWE